MIRVFNTQQLSHYIMKKESHPEQISRIKSFIDKYNPTIALNILYTKEKETCPGYISKSNSSCEEQIILLMILNKEKEEQNYLTLKNCLHY